MNQRASDFFAFLAAIKSSNESCGQPSATVSEGGEERVSAATSSPHDLVDIVAFALMRDCLSEMPEEAERVAVDADLLNAFRHDTRTMFEFVEKAGHRIVPVEPTERMLEAADDAAARVALSPTITHHDTGLAVWPAMLSACPKVTHE